MGMDGGCQITKIEDIKENWKEIRKRLITQLGVYEKDSSIESSMLKQARELPEDINNLSSNEILSLLSFLEYRDCPFLFDDKYIVTGYGDNVTSWMKSLSCA